MKIGELIKRYRDDHGLSQRQLAIQCGLSNGYISILEKGANPKTGKPVIPTLPQLKKLAGGLGMTVMELLDQVEDMPIDLETSAGISYPDNVIPLPQMRKIPLLGAIACGAPILADEHIEGQVDIPASIHANFALTCKGDSMINARIFDGDIVYIRQQEEVQNGEIAAVLIDNEATLKRVHLYPDRIVLAPENPMYKPLVYWNEEMNTVHILGKAVAFTSAIR